MLSGALLDAAARLASGGGIPSLLEPLAHARIALPNLGQLAPVINLVIDATLTAFLFYILLAARKGR